jgi:hypothetical protein
MPMFCKAMERSKRCLDKMKPKFISQAAARASEDKLEKNMERLGSLC